MYHSMAQAGVVGLAKVISEPRPDPKNGKLTVVDLEFVLRLEPPTSLREIKESYGKNLVAIRGSNLNGVLDDQSLVSRKRSSADEVEVELADGVASGALLKRLVDSRAEITKFEQIEASLNDIFIDKVKGTDA